MLSNNHGNFIIEDDYESEFKYYGKPIPALKALDQADNVIYLGSLSKIIPAAIRISYLVLPECLLASYNQRQPYFKQTASSRANLTVCKIISSRKLTIITNTDLFKAASAKGHCRILVSVYRLTMGNRLTVK